MEERSGTKNVELNFEGSHIGVWEWPNVNEDEMLWSDRSQEILGIELNNKIMSYDDLKSLGHDDDREEFIEELEAHLYHNINFNCEFRIKRPNNESRWVQMKGQAQRNEEGQAVSMSGILLDIHDRKIAEIQTEESLAFLLTAEQASGIGSFKWDPIADEVWISKNAQLLLGLDESVASSLMETFTNIAKEEKDDVVDRLKELAKQEEHITVSFTMNHGEARDLQLKCRKYENEWTGEEFYIGIIQDQTELKAKERLVEDLIANLRRSNEELEQFAYIASHDLQEPLRKIQTFGDRLLHKAQSLPEKEQLYIQRMQSAAQRMQALIRDLLDYSRASRIDKTNEKVDLQVLFNILKEDLEGSITAAGATVEIGAMPKVKANEKQLYRLFQNLLSNAIKFRKPDQNPLVEIDAEEVGSAKLKELGFHQAKKKKYIQITVKDNGIGFEEEFTDKIFTIFQRLHGRTEYEGTGIGLAVCKKIVENHNGFILAKSKVSEGASFFVFLPKNKKK